ncbi:hypothetical protein Q7P37_011355 [Cladosporium fusiforme]
MPDLTAQPLGPTGGFNWVFLVDLLVCMVLALFFLFYFNRLFATLLSYAIRAWTWHKYRAYIDISALQISLLGGRLFFKSLRYHAHNETVLVHDGHITWRYWLRAVQEAEIYHDLEEDKLKKKRSASTSGEQESDSDTNEKKRSRSRSMSKAEAGGKQRKELPCRISVKVSGVEAFLYNRSPAYDMIVEAANRQAGRPKDPQDENGKAESPPASSGSDSNEKPGDNKENPNLRKTDTATTNLSQEQHQAPQIPSFLRMLPIKIYCKKAAAAVGNENTTSVITAKLDNASGTFDAGKAGELDIFKLLMKFEFKNINVAMKPNRDFKHLQLDAAKRIVRERELHGRSIERPTFHPFEGLKAPLQGLKNMFHRRKRSRGSIRAGSITSDMHNAPTAVAQEPVPGQAQWHGLMRYLDDNEEGINEWEDVEYAKASTLVDVDQINMRFYWDIPGKIPQTSGEKDHLLQSDQEDHMNGSKPPDYGLEFAVHGGFIVYGPWADRQRINLQNVFFPGSYVDATPSQPLKPGTDRVSTIFKIYISIEKDVTLRIPTREPSKDSKWQGRADRNKPDEEQDTAGGKGKHSRRHRRRKGKKSAPADARPYAWLDIKVKADTTVNYVMDMYARHNGYRNSLDLDVKGTEITSSVNHGLLWRAGALSMEADLSYPVAWNTIRDWPFQITCDDLELFILRDHMFLITDLVNDWSSGPPPEFYTFVPYKYAMNLNFRNWTMYLNTNDANIINDPAEFDKNEFLTLEGRDLRAVLGIPLEHFRPKVNDISFDVLSQGMSMRMLNSPRNTLKTLLPEKQVAELPKLTLKGSFSANQESAAGLCDVLRMDLVGYGLSLKAYGFLVRHFINVKENYFGDYVHFKTLEEFQDAGNDLNESNEKTVSLPKPQTANEMDVILCIAAEDATVMFPTNLYLADEFVRVDVQHGAIDLRLTSYYMDLAINFSPINCLLGSTSGDSASPDDTTSSTQLCIRHVDLNGHRAFGLPPNEPAYAATWDVNVGAITGELHESFVHDLALAVQALAFTFPDGENALPIETPNIFYEVTFLQLRTDILRVWIHAGNDAFLLSTDPVNVDFNDWADKKFSERVSVLVPNLTVACVDAKSASRNRVRKHHRRAVRTYAFLQTSVALNVVGRKMQHEEELQKQQAYLHNNDKRTHRMSFLQRRVPRRPSFESVDEAGIQPPTVPCPSFPTPVDGDGQQHSRPMSIKSTTSFVSNKLLRSKPSTSSLSASIRSKSKLTVPEAPRARSQRSSSRSGRSVSSQASSEVFLEQQGTLPSDRERAKFGLPPSTMAFSSSYAEPYFPLDLVDPDVSNVPEFDMACNTGSEPDDEPMVNFEQDDESSQASILIRLVPGVRAYIEPRAALAAATLLRVLQPKKSEEIMDAYQVSVMSTILGQQQEHSGAGNVMEVKVDVPSAPLRVCVMNEHDVAPDVADVSLKNLSFMMRQKKEPAHKGREEKLAFHIVLSSLKASLHEHFTETPEGTALSLNVDDVTTWFALAAVKTFHVSVRDIAVLTSSKKAAYLTALAQRLTPLVQELQESFTSPLEASHKRLQVLVHTLTEHGEHIGDPPFMSRMTYILRAFRDHYRNQESWKVLMRFRHTLQCMPKGVLFELETHFKGEHISCPANIGQQVLESWTAWRNWDVPNIGRTTALQMLFGETEEMPLHSPDAKPTAFTWDTESLKVAIDQGEGANKIVIDDISVGLEISPPKVPTGLMLVDENKRTKTQLQIHAGSIGFRFDWNVIGIIETVVPEVQRLVNATKSEQEHRSPSQALEEGLNRQDIHVVISTDTGSILLESINLRHHSQAEGMRMSLCGTTQATDKYGECLSVVVHAESAVTELHGPSTCIWQTLLTAPNIYVDWLQPAKGVDTPSTVTLALAYGELQIDVKEQVPGILQVVDHIVNDEVRQVQNLVKLIEATVPQSSQGDDSSKPSSPVKFHAAILAGKLLINVSLLQALSYRMEITAASLRVAPSLVKQHSLGIDFNMGAQNHAFVNHSGDEDHEQGLLEVPPIIGHVGLDLKSDDTRISVATTVKKIEIDAGTIQSIVTVLNKKEVQGVLSEIKSGIADVKQSVSEAFPANSEAKAEPSIRKTPDKLIIYDVQFALLGIRVSARTPHLAAHSTAELELGIGPLHAKASNQANIDAGDASLFPEVKGKVQDVGANLTILEGRLRRQVGSARLAAVLDITLHKDENGTFTREVAVRSPGLEVNAYPETASIIVDVANHMQDRIKELDLSREVDYIRRLRAQRKHRIVKTISGRERKGSEAGMPFSATDLLAMRVTVEFSGIQFAWLVDPSYAPNAKSAVQDLVLSLARVEFTTRGGHEARLTMQDLQLQLVPKKASRIKRTLNSALLPEVGFSVGYWSKDRNRSLAFKATGKPLDIRLESKFIVPVSGVQKSIEFAIERFRTGTANWQSTPTTSGMPRTKILGKNHFASLLVEADFAGAHVYLQGAGPGDPMLSTIAAASQDRSKNGRYGQFSPNGDIIHTSLKAPGIALKLEYNDTEARPSVSGELRVDASKNLLLPNVVPLVLEISDSVKEVMQSQEKKEALSTPTTPLVKADAKAPQRFFEDESIVKADPTAIFGKTKVDLGVRICKQEFGLTCQPIARVDATAQLEDFYFTVNTLDSEEQGHFFAMSAVLTKLSTHVKHVYSREPTFSFDMDSIVLSLMNSKHFSGVNGISAILKINPTKTSINAKQLQDLLLFREIWLPPEIRTAQASNQQEPQQSQSDDYLVQRYQTVAAAAAFPWNATVSIAELGVDLDLGQSIGKSSFTISNLWASSQKTSNWEQNLCIGIDDVAANSHGRMSGFIQLNKFGVRTSIRWPEESQNTRQTPLIQASVGFQRLRAKAAFDYQAFAFGDIEGFDFLMYNVRDSRASDRDRLVAVLDCAKAYVFCTSTSPAQAYGLYQAFDRLIQEKQAAFEHSLKDIEKQLRRDSTAAASRVAASQAQRPTSKLARTGNRTPFALNTDVVVTVGAISVGAFPGTFFDSQVLKFEATNIQARFAVGLEKGKIHSGLGMTLGQLQVALGSAKRVTVPKTLGDITVDEVISSAVNSKGGIILRVPKVVASMQTWQAPDSNDVEYVFKSLFEGKIDVGWNLSRINFIKGMYVSHTRALASRLGKPLPESAVKITAGPQKDTDANEEAPKDTVKPPGSEQEQQKITAEVNLPQSRYEYKALEPPIIETPQLRDMGEATPPLEWIGLHRDRLPNVTHQIIIVSLLEVAKEVEDAYARILGSS